MATLIELAAVLLVAGFSGQYVDSIHLAGINTGLSSGPAAKNYGILADHLYTSTQSSELADNTRAAESLLAKHPDANEDLVSLTNAFKSLKVDESDPESMCSKDNLANMRHVADFMREGGNLGPGKITEPIRRLNRMLVKYIAHAQPTCPKYLDGAWPEPWNPSFSNKDARKYLKHLERVPQVFVYEGYLREDIYSEHYDWIRGLSNAVADDALADLSANKKLVPRCSNPVTTTDKNVLALQLHEYVYKTCEEFVHLEESANVLVPYNNLLISMYMIDSAYGLDEYFKDEGEPRGYWEYRWGDYKDSVRDLVFAHRACERILAMPEKDVLKQLRDSRKQQELATKRRLLPTVSQMTDFIASKIAT